MIGPNKAPISILFRLPALQQNHPQTTHFWQPQNKKRLIIFMPFATQQLKF